MKEMDLQQATNDALRTDLTPAKYDDALCRLAQPGAMQLLHGMIGLTTEIGEFADVIKKYVFYGKPMDRVNLHEEGGDITWYLRIIAAALQDVTAGKCSFEEMIQRNVEKLRIRFPKAFEEDLAINRDHAAERPVLEGQGPKDQQAIEGMGSEEFRGVSEYEDDPLGRNRH